MCSQNAKLEILDVLKVKDSFFRVRELESYVTSL